MKNISAKRIMTVLLVIAIFVSSLPMVSFAADGEFDLSVFEGSEYYEYDKFEKTWKFLGSYTKNYSDASIYVYLLLFPSYVEKEWGPEFRVVYYDKEKEAYNSVISFEAYVDGAMFSLESLKKSEKWSFAFGGNVAREFVSYLEGAQEVAFRVKATDGTSTFTAKIDPVDVSSLYDLIQVNKLLIKSNAWQIDKTPEESDASVSASMDLSDAQPRTVPAAEPEIEEEPDDGIVYETLEPGSRGDEVKKLQKRLIELNFLPSGFADGDYGQGTTNAVSAFQYEAGLPQTGVADNKTQKKLYSDSAPKAKVYGSLNYDAISRDPDAHKGELIKFDGRVRQVLENGNTINFRIASSGKYDDIVYCIFEKPSEYKRILEDDKVTVYGTCNGLYSYKSTSGTTITIPLCMIDRIEVRAY